MLLLLPLSDTERGNPQIGFERARQQFLHGHLEESEIEANRGFRRFADSNPEWASRFRLLEAESMVWRGMYDGALRILASSSLGFKSADDEVDRLTLEGVVFTHLQRLPEADQELSEAEHLCAKQTYLACGGVLRARGILALENGKIAEAQQFFLASLSFARAHFDQPLETTALLNLGTVCLQNDHYDEALDWSLSAYRAGLKEGDENRVQGALGNLGWAYFELGDIDRALELFIDAGNRAAKLGNIREELKWLTAAANAYQEKRDLARSTESFGQALALAKQINSKEDIVNALEDLAHASIDSGNLDDASAYLQQLNHQMTQSPNRLDALDIVFAQGRIAAARRNDQQAESMFHEVDKDTASDTSMRLGAEHESAKLYELEEHVEEADRMYRTALTTFESARFQLKNEDSKLPFLANATGIYDGYIHFLVSHGKADEALRIADQSRAQTLAQGLGVASKTHSLAIPALHPTEIARKTGATLLFYWLGEKQSYLWAINAKKTDLFPLPPQREIAQSVERYRKTLLGFADPVENADADGVALYRMLVAPVSAMLQPNSNVVILCDSELSRLNFETLIVPGPHPHYWIEDANLVSAPSLHLLASANSADRRARNLLLFGDAVSPNADYPELPMAASEMRQIERHFKSQDETVYSRERANAEAYLAGKPQDFAYIHFVAHGVASRTDPLDSAIILSRSTGAEDSFKLHAREIIQHPINARLVTISACYGSGTRSYAGEGLVGLAWAFLRAGAHNVIGALWEVSDESTSQLMGDLYHGLELGMPPSAALRQAKLSLLHSQNEFRKPFYWAPLQIYTGL